MTEKSIAEETPITVKIRSKLNFKIIINNGYSPVQVAIPGTGRTEFISNPADVKDKPAQQFPVAKVAIPVNATYDEIFYDGVIRPVKGYYFIENPYIPLNEENGNDPVKKLNEHFKNFKKNDVVPVEYMLWRWCHKMHEQIADRNFQFFVDENNFHVIQWCAQALFNDSRKDYCKLNPATVSGFMMSLKGRAELIKYPDTIVNTVVGDYDILDSNQTFIEDSIAKLQAEIEEKQRILSSTSKLKAKIEEKTGVSAPAPVVEVKEEKKKGKAAKEEAVV